MSASTCHADSQAAAVDEYRTDDKKRLLETPTCRVTQFRVSAGQESPWHFHTAVADLFYVMEGRLQILLADPPEAIELQPGRCYQVASGRVHRFRATSENGASYLLIQGVGAFDFVLADAAPG